MVADADTRLKNRSDPFLFMLGRLRSGVSMATAAASLATVTDRLNREYRTPSTAVSFHLIRAWRKVNPYVDDSGVLQLGSALTLAMVGFVLLIACANVANLILTRLSSRRREIAVRLALGAGQRRLIRQLLVESLVLSCLGGLLGLLLGQWFKNVTAALAIPKLDFDVVESAYTFGVDWRIVGFTTLVTFLSGIISGLTPALQAARSDLTGALKEHSRASVGVVSGILS
jgi:ABC-type antimicrobial peptide transport system permease subunit